MTYKLIAWRLLLLFAIEFLSLDSIGAEPVATPHFSAEEQRIAAMSVVKFGLIDTSHYATGFVCGRDRDGNYLVLTGKHCVDAYTGQYEIEFSTNDRVRYEDIAVVATDAPSDLALLRVAARSVVVPALCICPIEDSPRSSTPTLMIGFPGSRDVTFHHCVTYGQVHFSSVRHQLSGHFWRVSPRSQGGSSGAPLLCKFNGGTSIGFLGHWWGSSGNEARVSGIDEVRDFLTDSGYSYLLRQAESPGLRRPWPQFKADLSPNVDTEIFAFVRSWLED